nr:linear amide C-N hydrolase [Oenococcus oeni]
MIGCTSLVLNASDKTSVLARTMDFTIEMAENVIYTPKEKKITSSYGEDSFYIISVNWLLSAWACKCLMDQLLLTV